MKSRLKLGTYKHFKGKYYKVLGVVRHSETLEELVLYRAMYTSPEFGKEVLWVRPANMFIEEVVKDGKNIPRFTYIGKTLIHSNK